MNEINSIDFIPISALEGKHFLVKNYQRGYKWEKEQIQALLNDIYVHQEGKYCLQPIVVHIDENARTGQIEIELIDGQQRITTIYLLIYYLQQNQFYTIDYQTRIQTQVFLRDELLLLEQYMDANWYDFIKDHPTYNNVDIFHFHLVFVEIKKWFEDKNVNKKKFLKKLFDKIHIIWYDIKANNKQGQAEDVFLNLNARKVPLTSSELVKALFILDIQKQNITKEVARLKEAELASEWDEIENKLQDDTFWFFLCDNDYYNNQDTRIDLIINLANNIIVNEENNIQSYQIYEKQFLNNERLDWNEIKQVFNKLIEWFDDRELYHYVGYLVVSQLQKLSDIIVASKGKNKAQFKELLISYIQKKFQEPKTNKEREKFYPYHIDNLNYDENRKACQNVLLLFNVQYYLNSIGNHKFPFHLYKENSWSVEHINPQNPRNIETIKGLIKWLCSFQKYFEKSDKLDEKLIKEIKEINKILSKEDQTKKLSEIRWGNKNMIRLEKVQETITSKLELHKISNLALLDRNTNSKLGNKIFIEKRKEVLELFYKGKEYNVFIPECTRDIFTKNYSQKEHGFTDSIFGLQDMEEYQKHIETQLSIYYSDENNDK